MSKLRLDKYLADMGVGTRQEVKALMNQKNIYRHSMIRC